MEFSKLSKSFLLVVLLVLFSVPAVAVDLLEVESNLRYVALSHNAHGPCVDIGWSHNTEDGNIFDLQASSAEGFCVWSDWTGHCGADGIRFSGEFIPNPEAWPLGWYQHLLSQTSVLLELNSPTLISASRSVEGVFSGALHTVTIIHPDGLNTILLGEENDLNCASELLEPGIYQITFSINTYSGDNPPFAYSGLVEVNWSGTVGSDAETLGSVKSLYRPRF